MSLKYVWYADPATCHSRAHHQTAGSIATTEEELKKLRSFQIELLELRDSVRQDTRVLKERSKRRRRDMKGASSSGDSGISSDSMGYLTDGDLPLREEHLSKLRVMAQSLGHNLPAKSTPMLMIKQTLQTTSEELKHLQNTYTKLKAPRSRPKSVLSVKGQESVVAMTSYQTVWRRRVVRMALIINTMLVLTALICWLCHPRCCDQLNTMGYIPSLRYVNGPPPT